MSALILKSKNAINDSVYPSEFNTYVSRVKADGGQITDYMSTLDAFKFIEENGLAAQNVFVATSPSWGVKIGSDGTPEKLYSLFGKSGDLVGAFGNRELVKFDAASYGYPTVSFRGSSSNYFTTESSFDSLDNLAYTVINRLPQLSNARDYGKTSEFGMGFIYSKSLLDSGHSIGYAYDGGSTLSKLSFIRASWDDMPDAWEVESSFNLARNTAKYAISLADSKVFGDVMYFSKNENYTYFKDGNESLLSSRTPRQWDAPDYAFSLGTSVNNSTRLGALYSDVIEVWVMRNINKAQVVAVSKRASMYN